MGRVRTKTVKKAAKVLIEKHYMKLTNDFHINKKILSEVGQVQSKRLRNKIAGFATHLMKRIQVGPVRGISLKVQEEEREKRLDFVPEQSEVQIDNLHVDADTAQMLKRVGLDKMPGLHTEQPHEGGRRDRGDRGDRHDRHERKGPRQPKQEQQ